MTSVNMQNFLAIREAAQQRLTSSHISTKATASTIEAKKSDWQSILASKRKEMGYSQRAMPAQAQVQPIQQPKLGGILKSVGNLTNRYMSTMQQIQDNVKNPDKNLKKTGNFIDIRA